MKFRKKPVVVEAIQFVEVSRTQRKFGESVEYNDTEIANFVGKRLRLRTEPNGKPEGRSFLEIETLEGVMSADVGDWIIKGVKGEHYPCKPDVFEATYEPVQSCAHKWGVEFSTHNHEPARTVCVKCGYKPDTSALLAKYAERPDAPVNGSTDDIEEPLKQLEALMHRVSKAAIVVGYGGERGETMLKYAEEMFMSAARSLLAKYGNPCASLMSNKPISGAQNAIHAPQDQWKAAIDHELTSLGYTADCFSSPQDALNAIISWHVSAATDPLINGGFQLVPVNK